MADQDYARLSPGGAGFAALVAPKRGRGRPSGPGKSGWKHEPRYEIKCERCGVTAKVTRASARWCGDACRNAVSNRAGQQRRRNSAPRHCRWCERSYVPEYGSLRTYYCTTECRDAAARKQRSGSTHRRRVKKYGVESETVNRLKVFARDGWRCRLCGIATPREAMGKGWHNSPELDHAIPVSRQGPHTYANTQCLCRSCNGWKADRTMDEVLSELAA